jgi:hypothetical protein
MHNVILRGVVRSNYVLMWRHLLALRMIAIMQYTVQRSSIDSCSQHVISTELPCMDH